jgi:hypothetical protein
MLKETRQLRKHCIIGIEDDLIFFKFMGNHIRYSPIQLSYSILCFQWRSAACFLSVGFHFGNIFLCHLLHSYITFLLLLLNIAANWSWISFQALNFRVLLFVSVVRFSITGSLLFMRSISMSFSSWDQLNILNCFSCSPILIISNCNKLSPTFAFICHFDICRATATLFVDYR